MADNTPKNAEDRLKEAGDPTRVKNLQAEELSLGNILRLKMQITGAERESKKIADELSKLSKEQSKKAEEYKKNAQDLSASMKRQAQIEKEIAKTAGRGARFKRESLKQELDAQQKLAKSLEKRQKDLERSAAVALTKAKQEADIRAKGLQTEKELIQDINKRRGLGFANIGGTFRDLFRSKQQKQLLVDVARAKAGGGGNQPPGGGGGAGGAGGAGGGGGAEDALVATGNPYAMIAAAAIKAAKALMAPLKALAGVAKDALIAPFADAAALLTGEDVGMGGGKLKTGGASSILGGLEKVASSLPLIGGIAGGLVSIFKTLVEAVLGLEQADFRAARSLNLSVGATQKMRANFQAMVKDSGNLALNATRMMESQIEIGNQLGVNKQLSGDILANNVLLKEVAGVEAESRQRIAETSIITGKNAFALTKSIMGTVGRFSELTKVGFTFKQIMKEAASLSGVLGLSFAKYPEKITRTLLATKAFGFELKQLDSLANSFLDFESSISKEMEAQVLTGKEMNLTAAREAALNNDMATLSKEITANVGDANTYLKMNRIQQDAIAESVGMTRDSLADVLRKQEMYAKLGATDLKTFQKKIELMEKEVNGRDKIIAKIGEANYQEYTRLSTAEKISEAMEKIKQTFIEFVKSSGLFDFITNPARVNSFIKSAVGMLAGAINTVSEIIAGILDAIASLPFTDTEKWRGMASQVRAGSSVVTGGMTAAVANLGGSTAPSISGTVERGTEQQRTVMSKEAAANQQRPMVIENHMTLTTGDGQVITKEVKRNMATVTGP